MSEKMAIKTQIAAAVMGSAIVVYSKSPTFSADTLRIALILTSTLLVTFGARMAAVFTLSVATVVCGPSSCTAGSQL